MVGVHGLELLLVLEDVQAVLEHQGDVALVVGGGGALGGLEVTAAEGVHEQLEELVGGLLALGVGDEALDGHVDLVAQEEEENEDDALVGQGGGAPDLGGGEAVGAAFSEGEQEGGREKVHGVPRG